jgi:hypothetical protein
LLIRGFWERGTDCIIDVRVTDTDAKNISKDPAKVLEAHEKRKGSTSSPVLSNAVISPFVVSTEPNRQGSKT